MALAFAAAMLAGGCSFERAFCGTESLACATDAEYSWVAQAQ